MTGNEGRIQSAGWTGSCEKDATAEVKHGLIFILMELILESHCRGKAVAISYHPGVKFLAKKSEAEDWLQGSHSVWSPHVKSSARLSLMLHELLEQN